MMNLSLFAPMGRTAAVAALLISLNACSSKPETTETEAAQGWWTGDRVAGAPRIVIDLSRQVVRYYKGGQLVGAAPISSGREGHGTVRGQYRIIEKDADHRSSIYGSFVDTRGLVVEDDVDVRRDAPPPGTHYLGASMRSFMRITGGIGMHEGYLPGYAASHGCIRLPSRMAAIFYRATPLGTPVEITGSAPDGHLTTWLPVPHQLSREDIVLAPKQAEDTRPKARVVIAEPPPVKPAPAILATAAPTRGETQLLAANSAKPAPQVQVAAAKPKQGSFWGGLFGGGEAEAKAQAPAPARVKPAPALATPQAPVPTVKAVEPQQIAYQPLTSLGQKASSSGWRSARQPAAPKPPKAAKQPPVVRGQTYFLPGVR